jgi:hypothetical protein
LKSKYDAELIGKEIPIMLLHFLKLKSLLSWAWRLPHLQMSALKGILWMDCYLYEDYIPQTVPVPGHISRCPSLSSAEGFPSIQPA